MLSVEFIVVFDCWSVSMQEKEQYKAVRIPRAKDVSSYEHVQKREREKEQKSSRHLCMSSRERCLPVSLRLRCSNKELVSIETKRFVRVLLPLSVDAFELYIEDNELWCYSSSSRFAKCNWIFDWDELCQYSMSKLHLIVNVVFIVYSSKTFLDTIDRISLSLSQSEELRQHPSSTVKLMMLTLWFPVRSIEPNGHFPRSCNGIAPRTIIPNLSLVNSITILYILMIPTELATVFFPMVH